MSFSHGNLLKHIRQATFLKTGMAALLVLLVVLRALIPAGYMPDMQALEKGKLAITICTGDGMKDVLVDGPSGPPPAHEKGKNFFCPFMILSALLYVAALLQLFLYGLRPPQRFHTQRLCPVPVLPVFPAARPRAPPR